MLVGAPVGVLVGVFVGVLVAAPVGVLVGVLVGVAVGVGVLLGRVGSEALGPNSDVLTNGGSDPAGLAPRRRPLVEGARTPIATVSVAVAVMASPSTRETPAGTGRVVLNFPRASAVTLPM